MIIPTRRAIKAISRHPTTGNDIKYFRENE